MTFGHQGSPIQKVKKCKVVRTDFWVVFYLIFLFLQIVVVPGSDKKIEPLIWLEECQKSIHFQMCREFQEISQLRSQGMMNW